MMYLMIIAIILAIMVLTRLFFVKKEIARITKQLQDYNTDKTAKKLDLAYYDKDLEGLAVEMNRLFDLIVQANAEKRRTEMEFRQAVANISHDIRTPLTSVFGYIQLLESSDLTFEEKKEYVSIIKNRTNRLKDLLNDFFELSIIESTDYDLKLGALKLNQLVLEVLIGFFDQFNDRDLVPIIDIPTEEICVIADESAVKRVIENLVVNAIKYSNGNVAIHLKKQKSSALLTIDNDANHLQEKDLELIFDRFYTADQTRSGSGTGLGLSIAKSLMLKMDGKITAELKVGQLYMKCEWKLS